MPDLNNKKNYLIIAVLVLIIAGASYYFFFYNKNNDTASAPAKTETVITKKIDLKKINTEIFSNEKFKKLNQPSIIKKASKSGGNLDPFRAETKTQ